MDLDNTPHPTSRIVFCELLQKGYKTVTEDGLRRASDIAQSAYLATF